jgi:hypothetical protein
MYFPKLFCCWVDNIMIIIHIDSFNVCIHNFCRFISGWILTVLAFILNGFEWLLKWFQMIYTKLNVSPKKPHYGNFFAFRKQIRCKPCQTLLNLLVRQPLQNKEDEVFICSHICGMFTHCYCEPMSSFLW